MLLLALLAGTASAQRADLPPKFQTEPAGETPGQEEAAEEAIEQSALAPPFTMNIGARLQVRASYDESGSEAGSGAMEIRRARLALAGAAFERFDYGLQAELAGPGARLLDAGIRTRLSPNLVLWAGQGKAPFGRQQLTSSGSLHFVDRSIVDARFSAGRQQGVALTGRIGGDLVEFAAGLYNGEGLATTANPDGRFMTVGRVVVTPLGAYSPVESAHDYVDSPRLALGVSGMTNSVRGSADLQEIQRLNLEVAFKLHGFNVTGELYRERAEGENSPLQITHGWYVQPGYLLPGRTHEIAGRFATLGAAGLVPGRIEAGLAYSYYVRAHSAKVQLDARTIRDLDDGPKRRELRLQLQLAL